MATEAEIKDMAQQTEITRATPLDNIVYDEEGEIVTEEYWQGWIGDPVDAMIQVLGNDEETARENLGNAAWEIMENRQTNIIASETAVDDEGNPIELKDAEDEGTSEEK